MTVPAFTHAQQVDLQQLLQSDQGECTLAALHGSISAMLACDHHKTHRDLIVAKLLPEIVFQQHSSQQTQAQQKTRDHLCNALFTTIHFQLTNTEFDYQLPDSPEDNLLKQVNQLVQWCEGFSLALAMFMNTSCMDQEVKEICDTVAGVQNISPRDYSSENIDQEEVEQISEYLRMGVVYIHSLHHVSESNAQC